MWLSEGLITMQEITFIRLKTLLVEGKTNHEIRL